MNCVRATNYFINEKPLSAFYINSCGYFTDIDQVTGVHRLNGREDFQLIGIINGEMYVKTKGKALFANKGDVIVFKPGEPQIYGTDCRNGAYYWIHFGGREADEMLSKCSLYNGKVFNAECSVAELDIISEMISEVNQTLPGYQLKLQSLFINLLITLSRKKCANKLYDKIKPAVSAMENSDDVCCSVKDYAKLCLMSEYYFIHTFKKATGKTPMQYKKSCNNGKC